MISGTAASSLLFSRDGLFLSFDTGPGQETFSQIGATWSMDGGRTFSKPVQVTFDAFANDLNPVAAIDPDSGTIYVSWTHSEITGTSDIRFVSFDLKTQKFGTPGLVTLGSSPAVGFGSGALYLAGEFNGGGIFFTKSSNGGLTFALPTTLSDTGFGAALAASGANVAVSWHEIDSTTGIASEKGVFSADGGASFGRRFDIHVGSSSTDQFAVLRLFFLPDSGTGSSLAARVFGTNLAQTAAPIVPTIVDVGSGGATGVSAFADFGTPAGGFTNRILADSLHQVTGYARSDDSLVVAAGSLPDGKTHLLQGTLTNPAPFSDLVVADDNALLIRVSGDDSMAFIVQLTGSSPGPIEALVCQ